MTSYLKRLAYGLLLLVVTFTLYRCELDGGNTDGPNNENTTITITTPQTTDSLELPFNIGFELQNGEVAENGDHIGVFIDGENVQSHYETSDISISQVDSGWHVLRLGLIGATSNEVSVYSEAIEIYIIPAETFNLTVGNGEGAGNYMAGDTISIKATLTSPKAFTSWGGQNAHITDTTKANTQLIMPGNDVTVQANYTFGTISFSDHVMPIIEANCALSDCHDASSIPAFTNYTQVSDHASRIVELTKNEMMPPSYFADPLPDDTVELIAAWVEQGKKDN